MTFSEENKQANETRNEQKKKHKKCNGNKTKTSEKAVFENQQSHFLCS